ncbi:MAG: hypothetical protein ACJ8C7_03665 [Microvirga sp.]
MKAENSAEEQLDSCWAAGRACNFDRAAGEDGAAEGQSSVRADFLRAMILRHFADSSSDTAVAATMTGASISGPLNLNGVVGKKPIALKQCNSSLNFEASDSKLAALLLEECSFFGLLLRGASIDGNLIARKCTFQWIDLTGAVVAGDIDLTEVQVERGPMLADRVRCTGAFFLSKAKLSGGVSFRNARLGSSFECDRSTLRVDAIPALDMRGSRIEGEVNLSRSELASAQTHALRAVGVNVVGMLSGTDATFIGPITLADSQFALLQFAGAKIARADGRGRALEAHNITVGMHVIVREGAELDGALWLNHANIGGNLDLSGCTIRNPGKRALSADLAKIKGDVFLRNQQEGETRIAAKLIASVSLTSADIGGSLFVDQVIIGEEAANTYINFNRLKIAGVMRCVDATLTASTVSLANSRIGMLADDIVSWPDGRLILNGCEYGLLSGDAPTRWRDRLGWLRKQKYEHLYVHPRPQPFSQLVSVLRRMGHERDARAIAIARRRLETAAVPWYSPRRLGG